MDKPIFYKNWHSMGISIMDKPIFYKNWHSMGISIMDKPIFSKNWHSMGISIMDKPIFYKNWHSMGILIMDKPIFYKNWYSMGISIMDKPIFYKNWHSMRISIVIDIFKEKPSIFLLLSDFENKYHIKICPLAAFYGIISALKSLWWGQKPNTNASGKNVFVTAFMKSEKHSSVAYPRRLVLKQEIPTEMGPLTTG